MNYSTRDCVFFSCDESRDRIKRSQVFQHHILLQILHTQAQKSFCARDLDSPCATDGNDTKLSERLLLLKPCMKFSPEFLPGHIGSAVGHSVFYPLSSYLIDDRYSSADNTLYTHTNNTMYTYTHTHICIRIQALPHLCVCECVVSYI